jgi:endoribonuclease Dicer
LTIGNLGPFCAEYFLYTDLKQRALQLLESATDTAVAVFGMGYFEDVRPTNPDHLPEIRKILNLVSQYDWMFGDDVNTLIDQNWCSPKVTALVDILLAHHKKEFQGIAFVEQRHTAACLARMIPRLPKANGRLKCAELIGHNSGNPGKSLQGMPTRLQRDVVQMFRDREVNLRVYFLPPIELFK